MALWMFWDTYLPCFLQLKNEIISLLELYEIIVEKGGDSQEKRDLVSIYKITLILSFCSF
jgi:hypothetical protein